jgi:acyl dehydratase
MKAVGDDQGEGAPLVAPPTYGMVYGYDAYRQLWQDPVVSLDVGHLVHGEQSFSLQRPVRVGDRITTTGKITGISSRGPVELVTFECQSTDQEEQPVAEATALFIIRPA